HLPLHRAGVVVGGGTGVRVARVGQLVVQERRERPVVEPTAARKPGAPAPALFERPEQGGQFRRGRIIPSTSHDCPLAPCPELFLHLRAAGIWRTAEPGQRPVLRLTCCLQTPPLTDAI